MEFCCAARGPCTMMLCPKYRGRQTVRVPAPRRQQVGLDHDGSETTTRMLRLATPEREYLWRLPTCFRQSELGELRSAVPGPRGIARTVQHLPRPPSPVP